MGINPLHLYYGIKRLKNVKSSNAKELYVPSGGQTQASIQHSNLDGTGLEFRMQTKAGDSSASVPKLTGSSVKVIVPSRFPLRPDPNNKLTVDDPSGFSCTSDINQLLGETPYVYLGGWGGLYDPSTMPKTRVDAGLQFNCPLNLDPSNPFSDYTPALFFKKEALAAINDGFNNLGNNCNSGSKYILYR